MNILEARHRMLGGEVYKKTAYGNPVSVRSLARMRPGLKLYGKSTQQTTTGAQLFDISKVNGVPGRLENNGDSLHVTTVKGDSTAAGAGDNTLHDFAPGLEAGQTYYLSANSTGADKFIYIGEIWGFGSSKVITESMLQSKVLFYASGEETESDVSEIMIVLGSTALPWEPYTGGEASPNPDYPQEITSAGDEGSIEVTVGGRNLFDISKCYSFAQNTYGLKVEAQGDYFVISGTVSTGEPEDSKARSFQMCSYPEDLYGKHFITYVEESENIDPEYKLGVYSDKGDFDINISLKYVQNNTYTYLKFKLMVTDEPGAFPYEPYKQPQTLTVQTPNGLPGIPVTSGGNYTDSDGQQWICDEIDFKRGKYVRRIGSVLADGVVNKFESSAGGTFWNLNTNHSAPGVIPGKRYLSIYFSKDFFNANEPGEFIYVTSEKGQEYFDTIDELNAFCVEKNAEGNPLVIYYPMEPIETDLSEEQLSAYANIHTNRPTTVVTATDDAGLELTYKTKKSLEVTD